jgi:replicative DNA helicase Mcm
MIQCGKDVVVFEVEKLSVIFDDVEAVKAKTKILTDSVGVFYVCLKPYEFDETRSRTLEKKDGTKIIIHGDGETLDDHEWSNVSNNENITEVRLSGILNHLKTQGFNVDDFEYGNDSVRKDSAFIYAVKLLKEGKNTNQVWVDLFRREKVYEHPMDIPLLSKMFELALKESGVVKSEKPKKLPRSFQEWHDYLIIYVRCNYNYNQLSNTFYFDLNDEYIHVMIQAYTRSFTKYIMDILKLYGLEPKLEFISDTNINIKDIEPNLYDKIISFHCDVIAVEDRMTVTTKADFMCDKCQASKTVTCDEHRRLDSVLCNTCDTKMREYRILESEYVQILWLSEFITESRHGKPNVFKAKLYGDFVGEAFVGQKKIIVGQFRQEKKAKTKYNEPFIDIVCIISLDEEETLLPTEDEIEKWKELVKEKDFLTELTKSAYTTLGNTEAKKTVLLSSVSAPETSKKINNIAVFLLGDPGTSKSTIMKETMNITQKCIFTTGKGNTAAGLTGGMDRVTSNSPLVFLPGALTIANEGTAIIDEIDKMNPHDREALLTAMAEGFVPINKVGMHGTLPTNTTILAAANPKSGRWKDLPILDQINLTEPLLSRFAIIWLIRDEVDEYRDADIAKHILKEMSVNTEITVDAEKIKKFINYVKMTYVPELTDEAKKHIAEYYVRIRGFSKKQNKIPIDPRKIEDLAKLTMAHARIHMRDKADKNDAKAICDIFEESLKSFGIDPSDGNVMETFKTQKQMNKEDFISDCLQRLGIDEETFTEEDFMVEIANGLYFNRDQAKMVFQKCVNSGRISKNSDDTYRL